MTQDKELVAQDDQQEGLVPTTDIQSRMDAMIANRQYLIEKIKPLLTDGVDIYTLPGMKKPSLGQPGAEKLAAIFNLTAKFEIDRETMEMIGPEANGKKYVAYICNLSSKGRVAGQGRGATFIEYMRNNYERIFENQYQALSAEEKEQCQGPLQGTSKAGNPYTYYRKQSEPVFDPLALNKAIKMAQKSAFVDAVKRATGMSDLFTQDVEDDRNAHDPTSDEPFEGTPSYQKKEEPAGLACPVCGGHMKKRNGSRGPFYGCNNYPKCTHVMSVADVESPQDTTTYGQQNEAQPS